MATGLPINTVPPVITGNTYQGSTYTTTDGTWSNFDDSVTYQWRRDGVAIEDATTNTYISTVADSGADITCLVTATNEGNDASLSLISTLGYNTPTPVIDSESNDTNTIVLTPDTGLEVQLKEEVTWADATSPYTVTYDTYTSYDAGDIKFRVKAEGVNPASDTVANSELFTEGEQLSICKVKTYVKDLLGADTEVVQVRQISPSVQYKTNLTIVSEVISVTPDATTGYVEFDLIETDNMEGTQYYLISFGEQNYKFQVPNQAEANFWDLGPVKTKITM